MNHDIAFYDPDHNEKIFSVYIEDNTVNEDYPKFYVEIPEATKEWSEEPEQQVIDYIFELANNTPDEIKCEFI